MILCFVFVIKDVFLSVFNYKNNNIFCGSMWLIPIPIWIWNIVALLQVA